MPVYEFRRPDGSVVEEFFHLGEAPSIGDTVELEGVKCVRLVSGHTPTRAKHTHFVAYSLPGPGETCGRTGITMPQRGEAGAPEYTPDGFATFDGQRAVDRFMSGVRRKTDDKARFEYKEPS